MRDLTRNSDMTIGDVRPLLPSAGIRGNKGRKTPDSAEATGLSLTT